MQVTTKAIVLSSLKYGDTSLIVKAFTASDGIKSYLLKGVLASRRGKLKTAYFQLLSQLEIVAYHKNKGTLETIREAKINYQYQSLQTNVVKNALTFFLAEMLSNSLQEEESHQNLFNFLEASLQWLDTNDEISNFHIYFLLVLSKYLGFYPETSDLNAPYFDLQEGAFVMAPSLNSLISGENLNYFKQFLGINFDTVHTIKMNKKNRQELLNLLVLYYELHLHGFRKPKSLMVLNEVFS
ncbi:DNA repair protein RecO [Cellulophaga sp. Hel_I_12]|uniref:DNA repair protein RecO n=1 Tax=Cellulophaga sp. Hel_I_12 TaxID=1249972 RepID=UPI00064886ED|nr:DNA repair protein RecO [Cellulophaga sp. Hel_I_12]